jgi:hypothetical protein
MSSNRHIRMFAVALVVTAALATETQAQRFHGAFHGGRSFGGSFAGRSYGFRAPSYGFRAGYAGYGRRSWGSLPGYSPGRFSSYGYAAYQPSRYGFGRGDHDFRRWYGFGNYPYWYGYGYPFLWNYGDAYPYYGESGSSLAGSLGVLPASPYSGSDAAGSAPAFGAPIQWPLGLSILPGADSLRQRIDRLYETAAAQAFTGAPNRQLSAQIRSAVKDLQSLVAWDKQERLTLSSAMYEEGEAFLRDLKRSAADFAPLDPRPLPAPAKSSGRWR